MLLVNVSPNWEIVGRLELQITCQHFHELSNNWRGWMASIKPISNTIFGVDEKLGNLVRRNKAEPCCLYAKEAAIEAYDHLRCHHYLKDAVNLVKLLAKPHIKSLLLCHDTVARKAYLPVIADASEEFEEDDLVIKVVTLIKNNRPLGLTLKVHEHRGSMTVAQIVTGTVADRSGAFEVGDEIVEINDTLVCKENMTELINILTSGCNTVKFKLIPPAVVASDVLENQKEKSEVFVRTLSGYNPVSDLSLPYPEAGLSFEPGEILRVLNSRGFDWLEAIKIETVHRGSIPPEFGSTCYQPNAGRSGLIRKTPMGLGQGIDMKAPVNGIDALIINPNMYEEVVRCHPEEGLYRPIVFIGPPRVGKTELINQLINTDPDHFCEPIRITTRGPKLEEVHGVDYLFVTDEEFTAFVEADGLIDQAEDSHGGRSGLCVDAVLEIIQAGRVAVFEANYQHFHMIRSPVLKPLVVFVKPPCLELLLETRQILGVNREQTNDTFRSAGPMIIHSVPSTPRLKPARCKEISSGASTPTHQARMNDNACYGKPCSKTTSAPGILQEFELHEMLRIAAQLEQTHQHYCDFVLINDDLPVALEQLSEWAYRIESEATWVPKQWLETKEGNQEESGDDPTLNI